MKPSKRPLEIATVLGRVDLLIYLTLSAAPVQMTFASLLSSLCPSTSSISHFACLPWHRLRIWIFKLEFRWPILCVIRICFYLVSPWSIWARKKMWKIEWMTLYQKFICSYFALSFLFQDVAIKIFGQSKIQGWIKHLNWLRRIWARRASLYVLLCIKKNLWTGFQ